MNEDDLITVLDFVNHEVRRATSVEVRQAMEEGCRSQGHYFATRSPAVPKPGDRCVCGDIDFIQWKPRGAQNQESKP